MGGAEQDGRLCHKKQTDRWTPWTLWQQPLALQHRWPGLCGPFSLRSPQGREQAGWLFRTVSVAPLCVPELDGVTVPRRALLPSMVPLPSPGFVLWGPR